MCPRRVDGSGGGNAPIGGSGGAKSGKLNGRSYCTESKGSTATKTMMIFGMKCTPIQRQETKSAGVQWDKKEVRDMKKESLLMGAKAVVSDLKLTHQSHKEQLKTLKAASALLPMLEAEGEGKAPAAKTTKKSTWFGAKLFNSVFKGKKEVASDSKEFEIKELKESLINYTF